MSHNNLKKEAVSLFLQSGILSKINAKDDFSLADELKKAKKNKPIKIYVSVLSFMGVLLAFTYSANLYVDYKNLQVKVNIQDFEDVNLTEMINLAKKNEEELNKVKMELEESQKNMELQIKDTMEAFDKDRQAVQNRLISSREKKRLLLEIKKKETLAIKKIEAKYKKEIDEKQKKVVIVKEKIVNYDKKLQDNLKKSEKMLQETMKKNESIVNETQKIYEIGLAKQKNVYETKMASLNTRYEKETENLKNEIKKINQILNMSEKDNKNTKEKLFQSEKRNQELSLNLTNLNGDLTQSLTQLDIIQKELAKTQKDFENTKTEDKKVRESLEKTLENTNNLLAINQEYLQKYIRNLDLMVKKRKDHGYILDSTDSKKIIIVLNNVYHVKNGDLALVFDENNQYVASLKLLPQSSSKMAVGMLAEVVEQAGDKTIEPFYKILIKFKTEKKK